MAAFEYPAFGYQPETAYTEETHRYIYRELGIEIVLDRFYEDQRDGLIAELDVLTIDPAGVRGVLHFSSHFVLGSPRYRQTAVRECQERTTEGWHDTTDFSSIFETVCYHSRKRWRGGEGAVDISQPSPQPRAARWLVPPFLEHGKANIIYAPGGTVKSMIAQALCASVAAGQPLIGHRVMPDAGRVLYLDWEADEDTVRERHQAICAGAGLGYVPELLYLREYASLAERAQALRRFIQQEGVGFVVVDSMGAARGGEPDSTEASLRCFNAARSLRVTWLGIDHMSKESMRGKDEGPTGSIYNWNEARMVWRIQKVQQEGDDALTISLTHRKANNGRMFKPLAYRVAFVNEVIDAEERLTEVRFDLANIMDTPELAKKTMSLTARILHEMEERDDEMSSKELALILGSTEKTVHTRLLDLLKQGKVVHPTQVTWALPGHQGGLV